MLQKNRTYSFRDGGFGLNSRLYMYPFIKWHGTLPAYRALEIRQHLVHMSGRLFAALIPVSCQSITRSRCHSPNCCQNSNGVQP